MAYFIGSNNPASGFGASGNFVAQVGDLGRAWQNTMLQGLNTQHAFNEFQNQNIIDPYRVNAAASGYGAQALQNLFTARDTAQSLEAQQNLSEMGSLFEAEQFRRNLGMNPDTIQYLQQPAPLIQDNRLAQQAPQMAQPVKPAQAGSYAATSPQNKAWFAPVQQADMQVYEQAMYGTPTPQQVYNPFSPRIGIDYLF